MYTRTICLYSMYPLVVMGFSNVPDADKCISKEQPALRFLLPLLPARKQPL